MGQETVDVLIRDGVIQHVAPHLEAVDDTPVLAGQNQLLLPGLVNAHAHMDKTLMGLPWHPNEVPEPRRIRDYVETEQRVRRSLDLSVRERAGRQARAALATGTTHIRTHVDIDPEIGLAQWEAIASVREAFRDRLTMQLIAFPQAGMLVQPGTAALLEEAVKLGADGIGGLDPSTVDRDPVRHLDIVFAIADRHGVEVDIHLHEPGMLGAFAVELIAERTRALGLQGRVTISHVFCLGMVDDDYLASLIDLLLENQIAIMSLGSGNAPFPPLKRLAEAGVPLCTGTDGVRDTWGPYNRIDMLDRVRLLGYRSNFRKDEEVALGLNMATFGGAAVMGDRQYGLRPGDRANLVVVAGDTPAEAVMTQPPRAFVIANGRLVAENGALLD
jgi:cytosine/adenosine deaminase-related metal-dependent hydrolase